MDEQKDKVRAEGNTILKGKGKPGRVDGKNSNYSSGGAFIYKKVKYEIESVLLENRDKGATKDKKVGNETQEKRTTVVRGFFSDLFKLGYKIESVHSLKEKHLLVVFHYLEEMGQSPSTIQNKISIMRLFCEWIGKNGMVRDSSRYVKDKSSVRRSTVVKEDKSWDGNGVSVRSKIDEVAEEDSRIALRLELCLAFGLRVREAMLLRPGLATEGNFKGACVHVRDGTKGGRSRLVPIENEVQLDVLTRAIAAADKTSGFLVSAGKDEEARLQHFYYVVRKCGLSFADSGVTAHGLRHQYMHESFKRLLGIEPPVRGGDLSVLDRDELHLATQKLMERAGHSRVAIGTAYYGSRRAVKIQAAS
ncbi:MAG: integrase domain-containing protein [Gallionella sp.]|jgi:site-specific recombinase XerD